MSMKVIVILVVVVVVVLLQETRVSACRDPRESRPVGLSGPRERRVQARVEVGLLRVQ